jgi:hypothetical protein
MQPENAIRVHSFTRNASLPQSLNARRTPAKINTTTNRAMKIATEYATINDSEKLLGFER